MGLEELAPFSSLGEPPWSGNQLRALGKAIRDGAPDPPAGPSYNAVMVWYDDLAACVQQALRGLDWESLLSGRDAPRITSRPKTIDTLREKLQRFPDGPLGRVQDVAGVRFECDMTLEEQDIVAAAIAAAFGDEPAAIDDIRKKPHAGYRAVHVKLVLPQGRVEVQVRTRLQGAWANAYEAAADAVGRSIRYSDDLPADPSARVLVQRLRAISVDCAGIERARQELFEVETNLESADVENADPALVAQLHARVSALKTELAAREARYTEMLGEIEARFRALASGKA
ncbi:hypothetical protein [Cellulomonas sp. URHB0016]